MTEADTSSRSDPADADGASFMQNLWAEVRGLLEDDETESEPAARGQRVPPTRRERSGPSAHP